MGCADLFILIFFSEMSAMDVDGASRSQSALKRPGSASSSRRVSLAPPDVENLHPGVIHIGMVRESGTYEAVISLTHTLGPDAVFTFGKHPYFEVISSCFVPSASGHNLTLQFKSDIRGEHQLNINATKNSASVRFTIGCAFMPTEYGKPALHDNVRLISLPPTSRPASAGSATHVVA